MLINKVMKNSFKLLLFVLIVASGCNRDNNLELEEKQDLYESNLAFINADWTFEMTGDSLKDQIIGLWLSNEVSYEDTICNDCDSLFTWVFESTGSMVKRNNDGGDQTTSCGKWEIDSSKKFIFYIYKRFLTGAPHTFYDVVTDTIRIEYNTDSNLTVSQYIGSPPTTKMDIKFNKLK